MSFQNFQISSEIIKSLENKNINVPTNSQLLSFASIYDGENVWLRSPTGSGKTLAYLLPIIKKLLQDRQSMTQVIFFTPTHELAVQISNFINETFSIIGVKSLALIGKAFIGRQKDKLKKKPQIVVGSVGRILELVEMKKLKVNHLKYCIIDEADRMLEDDSLKIIRRIIVNAINLQYILGSATIRDQALDIASSFIDNIKFIDNFYEKETIVHSYVIARSNRKNQTLRSLISAVQPAKVMIFLHRNNHINFVIQKLEAMNIIIGSLHGEQNKVDRANTIRKFKLGQIQVLVASDIAARGLDIDDVDYVINYDIPTKYEDYQHRAGRTGRMGREGSSILLINDNEQLYIKKFQKKVEILKGKLDFGEYNVS